MNSICFNKNYFLLFILLFFIEVLIALFVHDNFIRPYFGDVLVVILIYTFVMSFIKASKVQVAIVVLLFAFGIEMAQYFNFVALLGLQQSKLAKVVLGSSFAVEDLICYVVGIAFVLGMEYFFNRKK